MSTAGAGAIELSGSWSLTDDSGEYSASVELPSDIITGLHKTGLIPDPYFGRNEYDLRWIAEKDWAVSRKFSVERTDLALVLSEVDTIADVLINEQTILQCSNVFREYRADLSQVLKSGENTIQIRFRSNVRAAADAQDNQPYFVPYHFRNCPIPNGNMLRKAQCDFGWDWNIALAPFGIYGALRLEPLHEPRFGALKVRQTHSEGSVTVELSIPAVNMPEQIPQVQFTLGEHSTSGEYDAASQCLTARLKIDNPRLWWPAGQGEQALYPLTVTLGNAKLTSRIGLREIRLISEPDDVGRSFRIQVNGRGVFCKGANWIPADALAGRISTDDVRDLLQSAVDANMNMLRIWGGGRYEPDWFYDLCDELGLMIWQDFMFSCQMYPATEEFLAEVAAEVRENVARLQHHPCIALWCGDNELIGALTWFEETIRDRDRYLVAYDRLNRTIEANLRATDPDANWWPSSPSPGPLSFGDAWHDDTSGDMHFWSVWHEGRNFEHYRDVSPRFCSEFGFQSYPSLDVIRQFAEPGDFNIASPVMESHQKNAGGNARIAETMFRYFRFPVGFENFVYLSQVQQALAIKTAVTHWRSLKPHCMGTLFWQLNDTWPVCSWSSLNYGGSWKLLHHLARHFFASVLVSAAPVKGDDGQATDRIALRLVSDLAADFETTLEVLALSMTGASRKLATTTLAISPDAAIDGPVVEDLDDDEILYFRWSLPDGSTASDHFAPQPWKAYELPNSRISLDISTQDGVSTLQLASSTLALFVAVEASIPGRFSDNCITLLPGETVVLSFTPKDDSAAPEFRIRDLRSATYPSEHP